VAAGAIAKLFLQQKGIQVLAHVSSVGLIDSPLVSTDNAEEFVKLREANIVRCVDEKSAEDMIELIDGIRKEGDTVGGKITCFIKNCPVGLGEPVFDKLHADLGKAMLSINAVHGFDYGSGFDGSTMRGSQHNDVFQSSESGKITTKTNFSGGVQGGISNGMDINFRVAFKPVATIMTNQETVNKAGEAAEIKGKGRHDPCVVPRAVAIVEAMAALVIIDHYLRNLQYQNN
jgi:chorismate synthase